MEAVVPRKESDEAFLQRVQPELQLAEAVRLEKLNTYRSRKKIAYIIAVVAGPIAAFLDYMMLFVWFLHDKHKGAGLTLILFGALYGWVTQPRRDYAKAYKKKIIPHIARLLGLSSYNADGKIPAPEMLPSRILPVYDVYNSEDYFEGLYNNTSLCFAQVKFEQRRRSGKRTYYVTVFEGLAILLTLSKPTFHGHTILVRDGNKAMEWLQTVATGLDRANLVDPEFENRYSVFTNDQVEARYLLDPAQIERVKHLSNTYQAKGLSMAYFGNKVLLLVSSARDFFEPADITVSALEPQSLLSIRRDVQEILGLVEGLDLA
jgi:hypothetical protein